MSKISLLTALAILIFGFASNVNELQAAPIAHPVQAQSAQLPSTNENAEVRTAWNDETNRTIRGKSTTIIARPEPDQPQPVQPPSTNENDEPETTWENKTNRNIRGKSTTIIPRPESAQPQPVESQPFALGPIETTHTTGDGFDLSGWWDVFQPLKDGGYAFYTKYYLEQEGNVVHVNGSSQIPGQITWKSGTRFKGELLRTKTSIKGSLNAGDTEYQYELLEKYGGRLFHGTVTRPSSTPTQIIWVKSNDARIVHPSEIINAQSAQE